MQWYQSCKFDSEYQPLIYIKASQHDEELLIRRAETAPKPLYYRESFLEDQLAIYMRENRLPYVALISPDDFVRWIFPKLFYSRIPRYQEIADQYGYTITTEELAKVKDEKSFLALVKLAVARQA